jgi:hypothetical protein
MMQQILEKQNKSLEKLVELSKQDRLLQLIQTKETINIDEDGDKTVEALEKIDKSINDMSKKMNDTSKGGINSNVAKLHAEIKKSAENAKEITATAMDRRQFRGIGDRVGGVKESVKDFFTMRGFLDKTGIVQRGTGGIISDTLDRREERQKYVEARLKMDPTARLHGEDKAKEIFSRQFDEQQKVQSSIRSNESKLSEYKELGFTEQQIARSPEFKQRNQLAADLAIVDSRVRPQTVTEQTKAAKKSRIAADTDTTTRTTKPQKVSEQQATAGAEASSSILSAVSNVIPFPGNPKAAGGDKSNPTVISALNDEENTLEQSRKLDDQTELLKQIEENTRGAGGAGKGSAKEEPKTDGGSGILGSIIGFLGAGIKSAFKFLFNPKNLLTVFTRFLAPAMLIGSLVNGIMDGFKAFAETGSIGEALIAGLGGVLSFLTFGLFDADTIRNVVDAVSGFVNDYIVEPVKNFVKFIGESFNTYVKEPIMAAFDTVAGLFDEFIVQPLKTVFEPVTSFFKSLKDTVFGWFENFEIPGISFNVFGKEMGFGPWRPFKSETEAKPASAAPAADVNTEVNAADPEGQAFIKPFNEKPAAAATQSTNTSSDEISSKKKEIEIAMRRGKMDDVKRLNRELGQLEAGQMRGNITSAPKVAPAAQPQSGNAVAKQSEQNREANMDANKPSAAGGNTIVSAPTVNNVQHSQQTIKLPARNQDNSLSNYLSKRYA